MVEIDEMVGGKINLIFTLSVRPLYCCSNLERFLSLSLQFLPFNEELFLSEAVCMRRVNTERPTDRLRPVNRECSRDLRYWPTKSCFPTL